MTGAGWGLANVIFPVLRWESPKHCELLTVGQRWISCLLLHPGEPGPSPRRGPTPRFHPDPLNPLYGLIFFIFCDTLRSGREWCWKLFGHSCCQSRDSGRGAEKYPDAKGLACQGSDLPPLSVGTVTTRRASRKGVRVRLCHSPHPQIAPPKFLVSPWMPRGAVSSLAWTS